MDLENSKDYYEKEYIYFLQHPEKKDHYLVIQTSQCRMDDWYAQFHRTGKYENRPHAIMPHNRVNLVEKIVVPDANLFGLCYFICHETGDAQYEEDERYPYAEMGWYIIIGSLPTSEWLKNYISQQEEKKKQQVSLQTENAQITLF